MSQDESPGNIGRRLSDRQFEHLVANIMAPLEPAIQGTGLLRYESFSRSAKPLPPEESQRIAEELIKRIRKQFCAPKPAKLKEPHKVSKDPSP